MRTIRGLIYTDKMCFEPGEITITGDSIEKVECFEDDQLTEEEAGRYILPGLVDIHFHGCAACVSAVETETEGTLDCIREGSGKYQFSIAHTCADYETAKGAIATGATHVSHLYNAMPPFTHRKPGVIGAAAEDAQTVAELICDGIHIHPSVVKSTFSFLERSG